MEIAVSQHGKNACFKIIGNIDEKNAAILKGRFNELNLSTIEELTIDLQGVHRIGSSGIGKFLLFYKNLAAHGGRIRIENIPAPIYRLFVDLKLDTLFPITKSVPSRI